MQMNKIETIKELIEEKGITKYKVAKETGISYSTLSKYLTGQESQLRHDKSDILIKYLTNINTSLLDEIEIYHPADANAILYCLIDEQNHPYGIYDNEDDASEIKDKILRKYGRTFKIVQSFYFKDQD